MNGATAGTMTAWVVIAATLGCARDGAGAGAQPPTTVLAAPVGSAAPEPAGQMLAASKREPEPAPCEVGYLPPVAMILDNIAATDLSGLGTVMSATVRSTDGSPSPPATGYANIDYEVRVLRQFSGPAQERLTLSQGVEAPAKPHPAGTLLLFSACASGAGSGYEPDVGYFFTVEPGCRAEVEARAANASPPKPGTAASACQR